MNKENLLKYMIDYIPKGEDYNIYYDDNKGQWIIEVME
jgi:hypothetical protein